MLCQREFRSQDNRWGILAEEKFLRYRLQVVQKMADGSFKAATVTAIAARLKSLHQRLDQSLPP
jgi:hypothetical protein